MMLTKARKVFASSIIICSICLFYLYIDKNSWFKNIHVWHIKSANNTEFQNLNIYYSVNSYNDLLHAEAVIEGKYKEDPSISQETLYPDKAKKKQYNSNTAAKKPIAIQAPPDFSKLKTFLLFVGYPRSGSTLIGSMLDAHKNIVVANEYNIVANWRNFTGKQKTKEYVCRELWNNSVRESLQEQRASEKKYFFKYHVPGLWQGKYEGSVQIIGDKKSTTTTRALANNGNRTKISELISTLDLPVKFLHLVRNPFDNIATMTLRAYHPGLRMRAEGGGLQLNSPSILERQTRIYLDLVDKNAFLRKKLGKDRVLDVHYSSFIREPKIWLKLICDFLEIECDQHYLNSCMSVIFKNETYTRRHIVWPRKIKNRILKKIEKIDFLNGLKFEIT